MFCQKVIFFVLSFFLSLFSMVYETVISEMTVSLPQRPFFFLSEKTLACLVQTAASDFLCSINNTPFITSGIINVFMMNIHRKLL